MIDEVIQLLEEEYGKKGWIGTDPETFEYFRSLGKPIAPKIVAKPIPPPRAPQPSPKKVEAKVEVPPPAPSKQPIQIERESPSPLVDIESTKEAIRRVCPEIVLIEAVPSPGSKVLFLSTTEDHPFLQKVAQALEERGVPTALSFLGELAEIEKTLEGAHPFRMVLLPKKSAPFLRELEYSPETMKRSWRSASVLLLEDASLYEQDRYLKKGLWEGIRSELGL